MSNDIVPAPIYQSLTPAQVDVATRAEERIKSRTVLTVIENGRDLIEVKEALEHGQFTTWIEQAFDGAITIRTAQRWMNAAVEYGSKSEVTSLLGREVLLLLSAPSMPEEVRTLVEVRALAGEKITVAEVQELKREAKHARDEAERLKAEREEWIEIAQRAADRERETREHLKLARKDAHAEAQKAGEAARLAIQAEAEEARRETAEAHPTSRPPPPRPSASCSISSIRRRCPSMRSMVACICRTSARICPVRSSISASCAAMSSGIARCSVMPCYLQNRHPR